METLVYRERPPAADAHGLLILHHGRGADELDLLALADVVDPQRHLHVVTPRAPLTLPGWPGYHWYRVPRVGFPEPESWRASVARLSALHDQLWEQTGIAPDRTVLGGFSMGCVMSYSLGLSSDRPVPAGILGFSGFIPTIEGWDPDTAGRPDLPVFISHGRNDPVIGIEFARQARDRLAQAGLPVEYHEYRGGHQIEPEAVCAGIAWLGGVL